METKNAQNHEIRRLVLIESLNRIFLLSIPTHVAQIIKNAKRNAVSTINKPFEGSASAEIYFFCHCIALHVCPGEMFIYFSLNIFISQYQS